MSRIATRFAELKSRHRKALVAYITAGDPDLATTLKLMDVLAESGADIIELGVPFSDPMADGPVIQAACERALAAGTRLHSVLALVRDFRQRDQATPVVLMGYLNPVEAMGYGTFAKAASAAGVDGVLMVDLPPEEASRLSGLLEEHGIDRIFLLSPTSSTERVAKVCAASSGFVYYVSLKGVTGAATLDLPAIRAHVTEIRKQCRRLPLGIGFGIKDAATARLMAEIAEGVVVGSALVRLIGENLGNLPAMERAVRDLTGELRAALDSSAAA